MIETGYNSYVSDESRAAKLREQTRRDREKRRRCLAADLERLEVSLSQAAQQQDELGQLLDRVSRAASDQAVRAEIEEEDDVIAVLGHWAKDQELPWLL